MSSADAVRLQSGAREAVSDADLDEAAHFSKYAFAAYGYMLYVWSKPLQKCACGRVRCSRRMLCGPEIMLEASKYASSAMLFCWQGRWLMSSLSAHDATAFWLCSALH